MNNCCNRMNLTLVFRDLWTQHIVWTRLFIISTVSSLDDLKYVTDRLLQNPKDFAKALAPYYGQQKAKKFEDLLTEHLTIAASLVNAAKDGKADEVEVQRKKWYDNADEIATFLASINCFWSKKEWQAMLYNHLEMTESEAVLRIDGQYAKGVETFDEISAQALRMADYMAMGIRRQFNRL